MNKLEVMIDEAYRMSDKLNSTSKILRSEVSESDKVVLIRIITKRFSRSIFTRIVDKSLPYADETLYHSNWVLDKLSDTGSIDKAMEFVIQESGR